MRVRGRGYGFGRAPWLVGESIPVVNSTLRQLLIGFALLAGGIMVANALVELVPPRTRLMFPVWTVLCLIPAYWYGHRLGLLTYAPWEVFGTIIVVLAAVAVVELWAVIRPLSAVGLAALVCLFFLVRRRLLPKGRGSSTGA